MKKREVTPPQFLGVHLEIQSFPAEFHKLGIGDIIPFSELIAKTLPRHDATITLLFLNTKWFLITNDDFITCPALTKRKRIHLVPFSHELRKNEDTLIVTIRVRLPHWDEKVPRCLVRT